MFVRCLFSCLCGCFKVNISCWVWCFGGFLPVVFMFVLLLCLVGLFWCLLAISCLMVVCLILVWVDFVFGTRLLFTWLFVVGLAECLLVWLLMRFCLLWITVIYCMIYLIVIAFGLMFCLVCVVWFGVALYLVVYLFLLGLVGVMLDVLLCVLCVWWFLDWFWLWMELYVLLIICDFVIVALCYLFWLLLNLLGRVSLLASWLRLLMVILVVWLICLG